MVKTNVPVLLMKDMVLFPFSEIRLEFDNDTDKSLISLAESCYDNNILVVNPKDNLEIDPDITELPKIGVVGQIKMKLDMPNGHTRVIISGGNRVNIHAYSKDDNIYEAMISNIEPEEVDVKEEIAYARSLVRHVEVYVKEVPYMSNTVLSQISGISSIDKLTDIVSLYLPVSFARKVMYIETVNPTSRVAMILEDINRDMEIIKLEKNIENEVTKDLDKSQKDYILREKIRVIKEELGDISDKDAEVDRIKESIDSLNCSSHVRKKLMDELNRYTSLSPASPEVGIIRNYIDWLIKLPWNNCTKDTKDLKKIMDKLDSTHYGLSKVKERIIEYIAVKQKTNNLKSPIICFVGPPGVGKTSLAKSIASSLNRNLTKISVGGVNDEADIVGHRRTYIGAAPGLIIQGMKKSGSSNPVFIIDEIDKMTKDIKGDPASSLLEVLDREQNSSFVDHYIEEEFDLSNVMFIATANYIENIPNELKDRLEIIEISAYTEYEKLDIAKWHLIPKLLVEHGLGDNDVVFSDDALMEMIRCYTKEAGVRELERVISTVLRKLVVLSLTKKDIFPKGIMVSDLKEFLSYPKYDYNRVSKKVLPGVVNGMAYTNYGGDILPIEVTTFKGKGDLILTGSLGKVMCESARISLSYISSCCDVFGLSDDVFENKDIHIHFPEGAIYKDGPSAGVAITTALISKFKGVCVDSKISMTGEMTLQGMVLPIGGLKEKLIGAHRAGIKKVFIPKENSNDLNDIPKDILKGIKVILVSDYLDIYNNLGIK